jgi:hypothetical protein
MNEPMKAMVPCTSMKKPRPLSCEFHHQPLCPLAYEPVNAGLERGKRSIAVDRIKEPEALRTDMDPLLPDMKTSVATPTEDAATGALYAPSKLCPPAY